MRRSASAVVLILCLIAGTVGGFVVLADAVHGTEPQSAVDEGASVHQSAPTVTDDPTSSSYAHFSQDPSPSLVGLESADSPVNPTAPATAAVAEPEFDRTTFDVAVESNGDAVWTFEYEKTLETDEDVAEFEEFAEAFEEEESDLYDVFTEQADRLVGSAQGHTDREMAATEFNRSAGVVGPINQLGVVEMRFTWEGFAETDGERLIVTDGFQDGFFLMEGQSLVIHAPEGYTFDTVEPDGEYVGRLENTNSVTWVGELDFLDGRPYVELVAQDDAAESEETDGGSGLLSYVTAVGLIAAAAIVLALVGFRRGVGRDRIAAFLATDAERGRRRVPHPRTRRDDLDRDSVAADDLSPAIGGPSDDLDGPSDEAQVIQLLEANGGRMKQVAIVDATEWSKSKVSMLLSEMEADGTITKLRVGRENIVSLDGYEPAATHVHHDE